MDATDTVEIDGTIHLTLEDADRLIALYLAANEEVCAKLAALLPVDQVMALIREANKFDYDKGAYMATEIPMPLPKWVDEKDVLRTIFVWSPFYDKPVTAKEAVGMMMDVARLGSLLAKHGGGTQK